jgi:hypothetical protein
MPHRVLFAVSAGLALLMGAGPAAALPVSASLSHPLATGWMSLVCGGAIPEICVVATVHHDLTIHLPNGSAAVWRIGVEGDGALSSIHAARPVYDELTALGGTLAALDENLVPYSTTSFDLFEVGGVVYSDFNFTEWAPAAFRYTAPGGAQHLLVGDGTGRFVPEPPRALLLLAAAASTGARALLPWAHVER